MKNQKPILKLVTDTVEPDTNSADVRNVTGIDSVEPLLLDLERAAMSDTTATLDAAHELYELAKTHMEAASILADTCTDLVDTDPALYLYCLSKVDGHENRAGTLAAAADLLTAFGTFTAFGTC
jgi:hypothetical protein